MLLLQLLWIALIWLTGASENHSKLITLGVYSLLIAMLAAFIPTEFLTKIDDLNITDRRTKRVVFIILITVVLFLGFIYANVQRGWTWDEDQNWAASKTMASEGIEEFFAQYKENPWLGRQHPPLIPLINGVTMHFFGQDLIVIRLVSVAFTIGILVTTYFIGRELYNPDIGLLAAIMLLTFPIVFRLGTAALTDAQVTFFFIFALLLTLFLRDSPSLTFAVALGITIGLGLLSKYTMIFIYPLLLAMFLADREIRELILHLIIAGAISLGMLGVWLLYAWSIGVLEVQRETLSIEPGWMLTNISGLQWLANSIVTKLSSAIGVYNLPLLLLGGIFVIRRFGKSERFLLIWIALVAILLVITLPDHRYFMITFPAMTIVIAVWLKQRSTATTRLVLLSCLFAIGTLWFFVDWQRSAELFVS
jgi:4-amino-4-deoxy-L-arabinose transferase-like glycosyltransferase